jgi:hypothetical protein
MLLLRNKRGWKSRACAEPTSGQGLFWCPTIIVFYYYGCCTTSGCGCAHPTVWTEVTSVICTVRKYVLRMRNRKLRHILPSGAFWPEVRKSRDRKSHCPEVALTGALCIKTQWIYHPKQTQFFQWLLFNIISTIISLPDMDVLHWYGNIKSKLF